MSRSTATAPDQSHEFPSFEESDKPTRPMPVFQLAEAVRALDAARKLDEARAALVARAAVDEDSTLMIGADENERLLQTAFSEGAAAKQSAPRNTDDEPTLDAPAPVSGEADIESTFAAAEPPTVPRRSPISARPPALRSLVLTTPPPKSSPGIEVAPAAVLKLVPALPVEPAAAAPSVAPMPMTFPRSPSMLVMPKAEPAVVRAAPVSGTRPRITAEEAKAAREARAEEERSRREGTFTIRLPKTTSENLVVAGIWAMALSLIAVLMFMATSA